MTHLVAKVMVLLAMIAAPAMATPAYRGIAPESSVIEEVIALWGKPILVDAVDQHGAVYSFIDHTMRDGRVYIETTSPTNRVKRVWVFPTKPRWAEMKDSYLSYEKVFKVRYAMRQRVEEYYGGHLVVVYMPNDDKTVWSVCFQHQEEQ
jgi:hypothetical protein